MNLSHYNLAQVIALGALAVSAVSAVALAAIGTVYGARYRWYVRASLLVVLLGPLLLSPAFDLWLIFVVQAVSMVAALTAVRGLRAWWVAGVGAWTFRLPDALAATLYAALLLAPIAAHAHLPMRLVVYATRFGISFALLGLMGAWLPVRPVRWWGFATRAVVFLSLPLVTIELLDFSDATTRQYFGYPYYWRESLAPTWATPLFVALASRGCGALGALDGSPPRGSWNSTWGRRGSIVVAALVSLGVVVGYVAILDDPGNPQEPMPSPNGYDLLNDAIRGFDKQLLYNTAWQASDAELAIFLQDTASVRDRALPLLDRPSVVRLQEWSERYSERRKLARAWSAQAVAASRRDDIPGLIEPCWSILRLGKATWNGGVVIDMLIGRQFVGIGIGTLRDAPSWPDDPRLQPLLPLLFAWDSDLESGDVVESRGQVGSRHAFWDGRVNAFLERLGPSHSRNCARHGEGARLDVRLLTLELALAHYRAVHGEYPESLDQLVPEVLPAVPRDPLAKDRRPLAYQRQANGYLLYSVGDDGVDDGGKYDQISSTAGVKGYDYRLP